jgi:hypothetical protein
MLSTSRSTFHYIHTIHIPLQHIFYPSMSSESAAITMEATLDQFLAGPHTEEEGKAMLSELVRRVHSQYYIFVLDVIQIKYRAKVWAQTAKLTPGLRHAFNVLQAWHLAQAGDAIPWHHIKNRSEYGTAAAMSDSVPSTTVAKAVPQLPGPPSVPVTTPTPVANALATAASTGPTAPPVDARVPDDAMEIDGPQVSRLDKGKGRQGDGEGIETVQGREVSPIVGHMYDVTTAARLGEYMAIPDGQTLAPPQPKRRKISPQVVPAHHLATEGESGDSATPQPKRKKGKMPLARMTPGSSAAPPDVLWNTQDNRPTPMYRQN